MNSSGRKGPFAALIVFGLIVTSFGGITGGFEVSEEKDIPSRLGGQLEWKSFVPESIGEPISTVALADLDNDNDLETIAYTSNGTVIALRPDGSYFWNEPFKTNGTDIAGEGQFGVDDGQYIPPFFSSPLVEDITLGDTAETIVGEISGLVTIGADGRLTWRTNITGGTVISGPTSGDFRKIESDRVIEIAVVMEYDNGSSYLELYSGDGSLIDRELIYKGSRGTSSSVVMDDLIGGDDGDLEMIVLHPDRGLLVYNVTGSEGDWEINLVDICDKLFDGYQCATPAVADITGDTEKEIVLTLNQDFAGGGGMQTGIYLMNSNLTGIGWTTTSKKSYASPVVVDLDPNSPGKEIVTVNESGLLSVIGSDDDMGWLPTLWEFDLGDRVISSPAICDIDYDREPEIIVATEGGKVFCLDGDPKEGDDDGVPYPGDGRFHDVLWVYMLDKPTGISSPVVADIDLDGVLEVLIGDIEGSIYCITTGYTKEAGKVEWPTFHGNNNRNGTYESAYHAVDIYPEKDPVSGITTENIYKKVQPGATISYNLTIENVGTYRSSEWKERFNISVIKTDHNVDWSFYLDIPPDHGDPNPYYVELARGEMKTIHLLVTAPWEGDHREMVRLTVEVRSTEEKLVYDRITTTSELDLFLDFELNYLMQPSGDPLDPMVGKKHDTVMPGSKGLYTISILNKGNVNDTYDISLNEPTPGWDWHFIETGKRYADISLTAAILVEQHGGVSGATFTIQVQSPETATAGMIFPLILSGTSRLATEWFIELEKNDTLNFIVGEVHDFEIEVPDGPFLFEGFYSPWGLEIPVNITNLGNVDPISVLLSVNGSYPQIGVSYWDDPFPVSKGSTFTRTITIYIIEPGMMTDPAGTVYEFQISAESGGLYRNGSFEVILGERSSLEISTDPGVIEDIRPETNFEMNLIIKNRGNIDEVLNITADADKIPKGVMVAFGDKEEITRNLSYGSNITIPFSINISGIIPPGIQNITLIIKNEDGRTWDFTFQVNVLQKAGLDIILPNGLETMRIQMGVQEEYQGYFGITNSGNIDLDTRLYFISIEDNESVMSGSSPLECKFTMTGLTLTREGDFAGQSIIPRGIIDVRNLSSDIEYLFLDYTYSIRDGLIIPGGMTVWITYRILINHDEGHSRVHSFEPSLIGAYLGTYTWRDFHIDVLYPDIEIVDEVLFLGQRGETTSFFDRGETINAFINVRNSGQIRSNATDIDVYIDNELERDFLLVPLDPDEEKGYTFSFDLDSGVHHIRIAVDDQNLVYELNDQFMENSIPYSNVREYDLSVKEDIETDDAKNDLKISWYIIIALIIGIILVGSIFVFLSREEKGIHEE